ncbi:hypothetical protein PVAND_008683 [Polypedilum vanderplanki]|uniref:Leucine rich repeat protein n=1 Tax=Polypedilum vanderplanki TaxID=319348 RepID=A0A9J6CB25_POLVA|nr:hypothetical protein PVAND_008683 [Polypedilum vanderplanki]
MGLSFIIFFYCLAILKFSSTNSVTIECNYYWYNLFNSVSYECIVRNKEIFTDDRVNIEKAEGEHVEGKTDDDVTTFRIYNADNLKFFPSNINNVFKNLKFLGIQLTNIAEITSDDLKVFPKLEFLTLSDNEIKVIKDDTFKFNIRLRTIYLNGNKISHIDPKSFSELKNLEKLFLEENICEFEEAASKDKILEIVRKIEEGFCLSDKFTKTMNSLMSNNDKND